MASDQTDRRNGLTTSVAVKAPVKAATTVALAQLSGLVVLDGYQLLDKDRVLVKDQANTTQNGIYNAAAGVWSRAKDCDGALDLVQGTLVFVINGSQSAGAFYRVSAANPITVGTNAVTFSRLAVNFVALTSNVAAAGQVLFGTGTPYQLGSAALAVYVNGLRMRIGADFNETDTTHFTFTFGLAAGDQVDAYIGQSVGNLTAGAASQVAVTDAGDFYIGVTVEAVLQEIADAITPDNGDASVVLVYNGNTPVQRWNTVLTANRTATLSVNNAKEGAHFIVVRGSGATGNFTLGVGALCTLYAPGEWAEVRYDAGTAAWVLEKYGFLPSAERRGITSDNGDASVNLTVGTSFTEQRWATPLTADRTATPLAAGTWAGAKFRIARDETASGGFSLIVATAVPLRLAPGQWCDIEYTGTAWIVTGFGDLRPGIPNMLRFFDDFDGWGLSGKLDVLRGTDPNCTLANVLDDQVGGVSRMSTGADAGGTMALNGTQVFGQLNWKATKGGLSIEARVQLSAITNVALFLGFTNQDTLLQMPFTLGGGDALTVNANDAVGVLFDTGADTKNWWLVGATGGVAAAKQNTAVAPVAATFETWRIDITPLGVATFYRNGVQVGGAMNAAVTALTALTPVIAAFSRGAASRSIDMDYISVQQQR